MKKSLISLSLIFVLASCASIVSKSQYPVSIQGSEDTEFVVKKHGMVVQQGQVPAVVKLKSGDGFFAKADYTVEFKNRKENLKKQQRLEASLDYWYMGNLIIGGWFGLLLIDPLTGAMYKLPKNVSEESAFTIGQLEREEGIGNDYYRTVNYNTPLDSSIYVKIAVACEKEYKITSSEREVNQDAFMYECQKEKKKKYADLGL